MLGVVLCCCVSSSPIIEDRCDLLELNHHYDDDGEHVFTQLIFWQWSHNRFEVVAWQFKKDAQIYRVGRRWRCVWQNNGVTRVVTAAAYSETWTQHDPEVDARAVLPVCERRGLSPCRARSKK